AFGGAASSAGTAAPGLFGSGAASAPLPPEQAFGFEAIAGDGNTLLLRFTPARGYYLYRDQTTLELDGPLVAAAGLRAGEPQWPRGETHHDEYFGTTTVFFEQIDVPLPLRRERAAAGEVRLTAGFQGCQTDGICYPPMTRTVTVALPAGEATPAEEPVGAASAATGNGPVVANADPVGGRSSAAGSGDATGDIFAAEAAPTTAREPERPALEPATAAQAEDSRIAAALSGPDRGWALLSFFGFGLLLAFTPCVLPMIPILSGLIAGASASQGPGRGLGTGRAATLSLVYVLANALVFTIAGMVAGLVGANVQIAFQTPWVIVAFALLFVALALSSFGAYELQLPASLRSRLGALSDRQRGGSWAGVAAMGALSALIVGPCVAPPLAAAVLYIGQTQDPVFGGAALFLLAMGMGLPLIAFGIAAGRGLPTSGPWMTGVQRVFGFVFLGLAVWMLSRILPAPLVLALWGVLLLGAAAMAGLAASRPMPREGLRAGAWALALLLGVGGVAQVVGA
ncbi:protein-disulfide reductase DsbD, partial [Lysobacter sp. D1-1-M9]